MQEINSDIFVRHEDEEPLPSKIFNKEAEVEQMERMIAENYRMIELGDDIEGRKHMIKVLENEIITNNYEIKKLRKQLAEEMAE